MALALFVLWGLRPWEDNSEAPHPVPLGIEMAVGGGQALPDAQLATVADATAVPVTPKPAVQAAARAGGADAGTSPVLAVAQGDVAAPASRVEPPTAEAPTGQAPAAPEAQPVSAPAAEPPVAPVATPTTATVTGGGQPAGPVTAGGGGFEEGCEGDEYLLTITFLEEEPAGGESPVEIVLKRLNEDGSTDELRLEGDLSDARSLASTLEAEGSCVVIEIAAPGEEESEEEEETPGEAEEETPGTGEEAIEPGESPEPVSP